MIRKYLFRKNYKGTYEIKGDRLTGHLAFKTQEVAWLGTNSPVVVLVSVNSAFHDGAEGFLKMEAFISTIKSCVVGKICILIADTAHLYAQSLLQNSVDLCLQAGEELARRYQSLFTNCELLYWHALCQGDAYAQAHTEILHLIQSDKTIQDLLREDAESTYTEKRALECPDKTGFMQATLTDLVDQCVVLQLLSQRGYHHLFYPGAPCKATEYLHSIHPNQLQWIDVFLTIEKKTKVAVNTSQELNALLYSNQIGFR